MPDDKLTATRRINPTLAISSILLVAVVVLFMFQFGLGQTSCKAQAQSGICQAADDVDIAGNLTVRNDISVGATVSPGTTGEVLTSKGTGVPPEWQAGGGVSPIVARVNKTSDQSIGSTSLPANDNDFFFTVTADTTYHVDFGLRVSELLNDGQGIKLQFAVPMNGDFCVALTGDLGNDQTPACDAAFDIDILDDTERLYPFFAVLRIGDTAGTATLQWAQVVADSDATTLHANSTMIVTEVVDN